ncbi:hypothetical protein AB0L05_06720 [Nonomuraea pusilla]|uniref:hypothetical protein n=1 Tax=Nonomuraea pusilla TaxID=46177 RepID=UPI003323903C
MNDRFEERLIRAVMEEHARRAEEGDIAVRTGGGRGVNRRALRLGAVVAGAAAVTAGFTVFGGGVTTAYAVDQHEDGSVRVQINAFRDPGELEAELARAGIKAEIDYLPAGKGCRPSRGEQAGADGQLKVGRGEDGKGIVFDVGKGQVGPDETLVLAVSVDPAGEDLPPVAMSMQVVRGPVTPCEETPLPLPSEGSDRPGTGHRQGGDTRQGGSDTGSGTRSSTG